MSNEILSNDVTLKLNKCSGCRSLKSIEHFEINKKGLNYKTCNDCRLRNKIKTINKTDITSVINEPCIDVDINIQNYNIIYNAENKNEFIRTLLDYKPNETVKFIKCYDFYNKKDSVKLIFPRREAMIILSYGDTWSTIKRLIDDEFYEVKSKDCSICCDSYKSDSGIKIFPRMHCKTCFNNYCLICFFTLFADHKGLIKCPFCRNNSGYTFEGGIHYLHEFIGDIGIKMVHCEYDKVPFGFSNSK